MDSVQSAFEQRDCLDGVFARPDVMTQICASANVLASPLTSLVGSFAERTGALDTVQFTPILAGQSSSLQQLNPTARITLGKRISPKVFLTYSRTLSGQQDELSLLEYEENEKNPTDDVRQCVAAAAAAARKTKA